MDYTHFTICGAIIVLASIAPVNAAIGESRAFTWQMRRLMYPAEAELQREQRGHIMIYHGLTDRAVSTALDKNFGRIQNMMFTGTIITRQDGTAEIDANTGEIATEDSGCD